MNAQNGDPANLPREDRIALASAASSPSVLSALANDEDPRVRLLVASNPKSPPGAIAQLSRDSYATIVQVILARDDLDVDVLSVLAEHAFEGIRLQVARHMRTSSNTLVHLSKNASDPVRYWALKNLARRA